MIAPSQYRHAQDIVHRIRNILGDFKGYRALHADGRIYRGVFRANETARAYCRAQHLQGEDVLCTVRFSKGGGDPFAHFGATVGMATRFYLADGQFMNSVMLSQKLFFAKSIEQLMELLDALSPRPGESGPNRAGLQPFLARNPNVANAFRLRSESLAPVSFANTEFHSVHAFLLRNSTDEVTAARLHWVPLAGVKGQPVEEIAAQPTDVLFAELEHRLSQGAVEFDLQLELAHEGDPLDDATAPWPELRERVSVGRLRIEGQLAEIELGDEVMNHDPTVLTDGIETTNDPILQIRRGVYEVSAAQRSGGWKSCPFASGQ